MPRVSLNGVDLHYQRGGAGPPLVFVHGGFSDAANEAGVSVRDLAEMLRNDPGVALRYQHRDVAKVKREARKIGRVIERGRAAAGNTGQ